MTVKPPKGGPALELRFVEREGTIPGILVLSEPVNLSSLYRSRSSLFLGARHQAERYSPPCNIMEPVTSEPPGDFLILWSLYDDPRQAIRPVLLYYLGDLVSHKVRNVLPLRLRDTTS